MGYLDHLLVFSPQYTNIINGRSKFQKIISFRKIIIFRILQKNNPQSAKALNAVPKPIELSPGTPTAGASTSVAQGGNIGSNVDDELLLILNLFRKFRNWRNVNDIKFDTTVCISRNFNSTLRLLTFEISSKFGLTLHRLALNTGSSTAVGVTGVSNVSEGNPDGKRKPSPRSGLINGI
jgi:hypothetical protein